MKPFFRWTLNALLGLALARAAELFALAVWMGLR